MTTFAPIEVTAPCRIDLAGGTLDVYPLYLFAEGGLTVNAAISISSTVRVAPRPDGRIVLQSLDLHEEVGFESVDAVSSDGPLGFVGRAVKCYAPHTGMTITTHNAAPHGSGLGASSTLLMALSTALLHVRGEAWTCERIIDVGANLEAQALGIPTGKQDYYPALYGGVSALRFDVHGHRREAICETVEAHAHLAERLVLSFTGISHCSEASNWAVLRRYVEGDAGTRAALAGIRATAEGMYDCLRADRWERLPELLAEEWANRRSLADGVTTPHVDALMEAAAAAGARASKLCGAGGGGCMVTYVEPNRRPAVEAALREAGAEVLPYTVVNEGVQVREMVEQ